MAAGVAVAVAVTAVAAGDRRNWTVAAVAAVPERGVLPAAVVEGEEAENDSGGASIAPRARPHCFGSVGLAFFRITISPPTPSAAKGGKKPEFLRLF